MYSYCLLHIATKYEVIFKKFQLQFECLCILPYACDIIIRNRMYFYFQRSVAINFKIHIAISVTMWLLKKKTFKNTKCSYSLYNTFMVAITTLNFIVIIKKYSLFIYLIIFITYFIL